MSSASRLQVVGQEEVPDQPTSAVPPSPSSPAPIARDNLTAIRVGTMVLNALTDRFFAAFAGMLVPVLGLGSLFWLADHHAEPTNHQLAMLGLYALFVLALVALRRK